MASVESKDQVEWNDPAPVRVPEPSFWPAGLALGITLLSVGPALEYTMAWLFIAAGGLLSLRSLVGWLSEIRKELAHADE